MINYKSKSRTVNRSVFAEYYFFYFFRKVFFARKEATTKSVLNRHCKEARFDSYCKAIFLLFPKQTDFFKLIGFSIRHCGFSH